MEENIDLREYFAIIKKRFWLIALITSIAMILSIIISFFVLTPIYQTNSTLIVNTDQVGEANTITGDQFNVTQKLAVTYGEIIKSRVVLESVIKNLKLDKDYEELKESINVTPVKDTQIINISVEGTDPNEIKNIANEIPKVFSKEAKRITNANSVEIIDRAIIPEVPIKPNKIMNILIATLLGSMIGLFTVFILEHLDKKIKTPQDIERHLGLVVLGVIPKEERIQ